MEEKYTSESVQELLNWARETLENKSYPEGIFQMNKAITILDCGVFLEKMIPIITNNWQNPMFHTTIDHLIDFRKNIEKA